MSSLLLKLFRIYCTTDESWYEIWSENEPTTCPNNSEHDVNLESVTQINKISSKDVNIVEVDTPQNATAVQGHYRIKSQSFDADINATTTSTFSFAYPIAIISGRIHVPSSMAGDIISIGAAYDTTLGVITQNASIGDTVIYTSNSVINNTYFRVGRHVRLTNGVTTTAYYNIVAKDPVNNTFTINTTLSDNFLANSPTYIQFAIIFADNIELSEGFLPIGSNAIKSVYIPQNIPLRITYQNKSVSNTKRVNLVYDFYY